MTRPVEKPFVKSPPKHSKRTNLAAGLGVGRSVLYLARNVKANNDAYGIHASVVYGSSRKGCTALEYTSYLPLDIAPTWYNIRAYSLEANVHAPVARTPNKKTFFYGIIGLSYNVFSGTYTGMSDFLNLSRLYEKNEHVVTRWMGVNAGIGGEFHFAKSCIFFDYKMRVGKTAGYNDVNIQDVCVSAGYRFILRVPSLYALFVHRGTRSRYLLDTEEVD